MVIYIGKGVCIKRRIMVRVKTGSGKFQSTFKWVGMEIKTEKKKIGNGESRLEC